MGGGVAVVVGLLAWGGSWFLSPHEMVRGYSQVEDLMGDLRKAVGAPKELVPAKEAMPYTGPPGWKACRFSWDLLTDHPPEGARRDESEPAYKRIALGLGSVTNAAMLLAVLLALTGAVGGRARGVGLLLLACAAVNASWLYWTDSPFRSGLEVGFWMWLGGFALAGFGFLARSRAALD